MTYHKAKIVPFDEGTWVYWWEDKEGRSGDILQENIPEGAKVQDDTWAELREAGND